MLAWVQIPPFPPSYMRNNFCTIYLARHGETEWNKKNKVQGHSDISLNKTGEIQAKKLGEKLKDVNFEAVFSSDLIRAKRTAEIIILEKKLAVITTKALRERMFGRFEGKQVEELKNELGKLTIISKEKQKELALNDVENDEILMGRFIPFIKEVSLAYQGKNVLIVSHGGLIRAFLNRAGFDMLKYSERPIKNAEYLIVKSDGVEFFFED